jgi:hypothetical protein
MKRYYSLSGVFITIIGLFFLLSCSKVIKSDSGKEKTESKLTEKTQTKEAEKKNKISEKSFELMLGETSITINYYENDISTGNIYINLHENERTSVEAGKDIVKEFGGKLYNIQARGTREIEFNLNNRTYKVDPNRIFTKTGIVKTLNNYGSYSDEAASAVTKFINEFLSIMNFDSARTVIALHNNTNGALSINSYAAGGEYATDASEINKNPEQDTDDFFFVTDKNIFESLKKLNFNVALQNNENVTDDGSLSVYCGYKKIRYINVEAQAGHLSEQKNMLTNLNQILTNK